MAISWDKVVGAVTGIASTAASAAKTWVGIQTQRQAIQLQKAQVQAQIAQLRAQAKAAQAAASAPAPQPVAAASGPTLGGGMFGGIPPWMLAAGAVAALFAVKGMATR